MSKSFLLLVEGARTEKDILTPILKKYGFIVQDKGKIDFSSNIEDYIGDPKALSLDSFSDKNSEDIVVLVQAPRNRIHDWLHLLKTNTDDFERFFRGNHGKFAGIFIVFDVDHTSNKELEEMYDKYKDETSNGLLLLSSPCIEVLADIDRKEVLEVDHLKEYKKQLNKSFSERYHKSTAEYIISNFEELILYYLDKNTIESKSNNVMDHPQFVVNEINKYNKRGHILSNPDRVYYRYYTTVIYVCIAYIKGLTREIDNVETIKQFFIDNKE